MEILFILMYCFIGIGVGLGVSDNKESNMAYALFGGITWPMWLGYAIVRIIDYTAKDNKESE